MENIDPIKANLYQKKREDTDQRATQIAEIASALAKREDEYANVTGMDILHEDALAIDEKREYDLTKKISGLEFLMDVYSKCQNDRNYLNSEHGKGKLTQFDDAEAVYNNIFVKCPELKTDKSLIKKMIEIKKPWRFLKDIDPSLLDDDNFLLDLIKMNKETLEKLPNQKRKDFQFIKKAIKVNPEIILQDLAYLDRKDYTLLERTLEE